MEKINKLKIGLTNNQLKIIAMLSMLIDHVGNILFPQIAILRIIGRISFPIFAFMIAEGCLHTKNRAKYLLIISVLGALFQVVFYFFMHSWRMNILITFALSISIIYCVDALIRLNDIWKKLLIILALVGMVFFAGIMPIIFEKQGFSIDYNILGVILPVAVYYAPKRLIKVAVCLIILVTMCLFNGGIRWFALLAIPLLLLYNGERGRTNLKYVFYAFYPVHIVVIYLIKVLFFSA